MNVVDLIQSLTDLNIDLSIKGENLHWRASEGVMTPELHEQIRQHKALIIAYLSSTTSSGPAEIVDEVSFIQVEPLPASGTWREVMMLLPPDWPVPVVEGQWRRLEDGRMVAIYTPETLAWALASVNLLPDGFDFDGYLVQAASLTTDFDPAP
ncbi:MAG: hypothetical protein J5I90_22020 [Caldilineales bacterium]|nr:hypothetical protein [Caldilineales bacterium]